MNAVLPTVVMTAMGRQVWSDPAKADVVRKRIPLGKFAGDVLARDLIQGRGGRRKGTP